MSDKVYYDESCYVCSLEINALRSRGEACGIEFIDISADDFDGNAKDFEKEMIGWFDQKATKGPETFRLMYEKMGFSKSVWLSRLPLVRTMFDAGYYIFAYGIRPYLPKKPTKNTEAKILVNTETDFIDYDGMGNQGRFPASKNKGK